MSEYNRPESYYSMGQSGTLNGYITKVFTLMGIGLAVTAAVAFAGYMFADAVIGVLAGNPFIMIILLVAELGCAVSMSAGLTRFSTNTCRLLFLAYSALTGITFSVILMAYDMNTVFVAFLFAAVLFASCAIIGHTTNVDLTKFSGLLFGALLALLIMTVLSMFIPILRNNILFGYLGLFIFLVYTAFDMQKIKSFYYNVGDGTVKENLAVYGAFQLYLDFINIFLYILRILGNRRD